MFPDYVEKIQVSTCMCILKNIGGFFRGHYNDDVDDMENIFQLTLKLLQVLRSTLQGAGKFELFKSSITESVCVK
jgi:hypothetical protein